MCDDCEKCDKFLTGVCNVCFSFRKCNPYKLFVLVRKSKTAVRCIPEMPKNKGQMWTCILLNLFLPGVGTMLGSIFDRDKGEDCPYIFTVGFLQFLTWFVVIGWVWSVIWSFLIYYKSLFTNRKEVKRLIIKKTGEAASHVPIVGGIVHKVEEKVKENKIKKEVKKKEKKEMKKKEKIEKKKEKTEKKKRKKEKEKMKKEKKKEKKKKKHEKK